MEVGSLLDGEERRVYLKLLEKENDDNQVAVSTHRGLKGRKPGSG